MRSPEQDYDLDPAPPEPVASNPGQDIRSEQQIDQLADNWIDRQLARTGPDQALAQALALRGDRRLYQAITAKLQNGPNR